MAGVEGFAGSFDDLVHGDLCYDDLDLDLGQEGCVDDSASVALAGASLDAAAHDLGHGHACHTQLVESLLEFIKLVETADDGQAVDAGIRDSSRCCGQISPSPGRCFGRANAGCRSCSDAGSIHDLDRCPDLGVRGPVILALTQVCVLVDIHDHVGNVADSKAGIGACQAVLVQIQTINLHLGGNTQADDSIDGFEDDEHDDQNIGVNCQNAQSLNAQELCAASIEEACHNAVLAVGEEANRKSAPDAVGHMYRHSADRVVDLCDIVKKLHRKNDQDAGDKTDHKGAEGSHAVTARRDGNQACKGGVEGHGDVRLAVTKPGEDHSHNCRHCCRQVGVHEGKGSMESIRAVCHGGGGAAVETEPAEPENEDAQRHSHHVVAGNGLDLSLPVIFADPGSQHPCTQTGNDAAYVVDNRASGKIMEAQP